MSVFHLRASYRCSQINQKKKQSLYFNKLGDAGARLIGAVLKENNSLTVLKLGLNDIGDEGAKHLANGLKDNTSLLEIECGRQQPVDVSLCLVSERFRPSIKSAGQQYWHHGHTKLGESPSAQYHSHDSIAHQEQTGCSSCSKSCKSTQSQRDYGVTRRIIQSHGS
eukprot:m.186888 g.186888  ORF g.186888 m.186888 type:complete len:166 (-) comp14764_c0_seq9:1179-1676(-)